MNKVNDLLARITVDPEVMVGKPIVKGTRMTVEYVLGLLAEGISMDEILREYKNIKKEDIYACLAFARAALAN